MQTTEPITEPTHTTTDDAYRHLAAAAILQAVKDAVGVNHQGEYEQHNAQAWLVSLEGRCFAELAGLDPLKIKRWVKNGCKVDPSMKRFNRRKPDLPPEGV